MRVGLYGSSAPYCVFAQFAGEGVTGDSPRPLLQRYLPARAKAAGAARVRYYDERLSHPSLQSKPSLAALGVMVAGKQPEHSLEAADLGDGLEKFATWAGQTHSRFRLPEGWSGLRFVTDGMVHAGLLHQGHHALLSVPVPSLVTYVQQAEAYQPMLQKVQDYQAALARRGEYLRIGALTQLLPPTAAVEEHSVEQERLMEEVRDRFTRH